MSVSQLDPRTMILSPMQLRRLRLRAGWKRFREAWSIYARNRLALLGLLLLAIFTIMAVAHPILMSTVWSKRVYDPFVGYDIDILQHPSAPSANHLLGTDALGRDVLSILLAATTPSFVTAIVAALATMLVGALIGALTAYFRGAVDSIFMHLADLSLLAPAPIVMVVIGFALDIDPFEFGLVYGLITGLGGVAIVLRAHALTVMARPFVDASRVAGAGAGRIIFRHLIPHLLPLATVNMMLTVTGAIFASGFIAFLGLSRARLSWGVMVYDAFTYQRVFQGDYAWHVMIPPALAISLFAASFYMIARGLHEVVEPRIRER